MLRNLLKTALSVPFFCPPLSSWLQSLHTFPWLRAKWRVGCRYSRKNGLRWHQLWRILRELLALLGWFDSFDSFDSFDFLFLNSLWKHSPVTSSYCRGGVHLSQVIQVINCRYRGLLMVTWFRLIHAWFMQCSWSNEQHHWLGQLELLWELRISWKPELVRKRCVELRAYMRLRSLFHLLSTNYIFKCIQYNSAHWPIVHLTSSDNPMQALAGQLVLKLMTWASRRWWAPLLDKTRAPSHKGYAISMLDRA